MTSTPPAARMFTSPAARYTQNTHAGVAIKAGPARLTNLSGTEEPGVIIRANHIIHAVIPAQDALRLAHQIADAVAEHAQPAEPQEQE